MRVVHKIIALAGDDKPFDFGPYKDMARPQQVSGLGILHCDAIVREIATLKTGFRLKTTMLARAVEKAMRENKKKSSTGSLTT